MKRALSVLLSSLIALSGPLAGTARAQVFGAAESAAARSATGGTAASISAPRTISAAPSALMPSLTGARLAPAAFAAAPGLAAALTGKLEPATRLPAVAAAGAAAAFALETRESDRSATGRALDLN